MVNVIAIPLVLALLSGASEPPRFAEDLPRGVGYSVVFKILLDQAGSVNTCDVASVNELTKEARPVNIVPSHAYVADACKKLSHAKWPLKLDVSGNARAGFYFCRYIEASPDAAYCDRKFGE